MSLLGCISNKYTQDADDNIEILIAPPNEVGFDKYFLMPLSNDDLVLYIIPWDKGPRDYFSDTLTNIDTNSYQGLSTSYDKNNNWLEGAYKTAFNLDSGAFAFNLIADSISHKRLNSILNAGLRGKFTHESPEFKISGQDPFTHKLQYDSIIRKKIDLDHYKFMYFMDSLSSIIKH